jgi:hypothetical protein
MRWTHIAGRNSCATSGGCADGEVVWSWRSDAGAKLAKTLTRLADDGGKKAWSPERARISRKTIAQGRPDDPPVPVVLPRAFFSARGPWVRWAPGLPCALLISRAAFFQQLGHFVPRERGVTPLSPRRPGQAKRDPGPNHRQKFSGRLELQPCATTKAGGYGSPPSRGRHRCR